MRFLGRVSVLAVLGSVIPLGAVDLDTVTVTGTKTEKRLADTPVVTEVIPGDELKAWGATDLTEALAAYGLIADGDRSHGDGIQMQGLGGNRILVLIDGRRVTGRIAGNIDGRSIPLVNVDRIEVIRGPQSALYGSDAMGGVINIITKAPTPQLSLDLQNTGLPAYDNPDNSIEPSSEGGAVFQSQRATLKAGGRWNQTDGSLVVTGTRNEFYFEELGEVSVLPRGWSAQGTGELAGPVAGGRWSLQAEALTLREEDQTSFTGSLDRRDWGRGFLGAGWEGPWAQGSLKLRLGNQASVRSTASYTGGTRTWSDDAVEVQNSLTSEAWYSRGWGDNLIGTFGVDGAWTLVRDPDLSVELASSDLEAVVAQLEWFEEGRFSLVAGGRLERDSRFGLFAAPKLSGMAVLVPQWRLLAGLGLGYRAPTAEDLYYDLDWSWHPIVLGNQDLEPEVSLAANLGLEWAVPKGPSARVNGFHQELFREIVTVEEGVASDGRVIYRNQNKDRTLRSGWDAEASFPWGPWVLDGSWGYVYAWDRGAGTVLEGVGGTTIRSALRMVWQGLQARVSARHTSLTGLTVYDASLVVSLGSHWEPRISLSNLTSVIDAEHGPFVPISLTLGLQARI